MTNTAAAWTALTALLDACDLDPATTISVTVTGSPRRNVRLAIIAEVIVPGSGRYDADGTWIRDTDTVTVALQ